MLSHFRGRSVSMAYGILMPASGLANHTTFVVDKDGKIQYLEDGRGAVDITGAATACIRLAG